MKQISVLRTLTDKIDQNLSKVIEQSNENHSHLQHHVEARGIMDSLEEADPLLEMQEQLAELRLRLGQVERPLLDDIGREVCVSNIMQGLSGLDSEMAARVATNTYDRNWFESEPDLELSQMLAKALLEKYGKSPSSNVSLWSKFL